MTSLLTRTSRNPSIKRAVATTSSRALFSTRNNHSTRDHDLSAELLRGLAALNPHCPIATQTIENVTTEEVMKAVKARDYGAIANLQWTVEVDYLKKMGGRALSTDAKPQKQQQQQQQKREYSTTAHVEKRQEDITVTASLLRELSRNRTGPAEAKAEAPKLNKVQNKPTCKKNQSCWSVDGELFIP